jgi:hypothetical protein
MLGGSGKVGPPFLYFRCPTERSTRCITGNYDPFKAPRHFKFVDLVAKFDRKLRRGGHTRELAGELGEERRQTEIRARRSSRWNFLFIAGMWFQDLFNYDFRRTEMCIIPYATQQGEISFCAYNTGIGWRHIVEKMHMTATLTKWYEEHGRHEIFAGNKAVPLPTTEHQLKLNAEAVAAGEQRNLALSGVARNAREEKMAAHHRRMAALYRQHVLKEPPQPPVIQIQGLRASRLSRRSS